MKTNWVAVFAVLIWGGGYFGAMLAQMAHYRWGLFFKEMPGTALAVILKSVVVSAMWPFWVTSVMVERALTPPLSFEITASASGRGESDKDKED